MIMSGSFLPSPWTSTNHSLLGSQEPALLCNQVLYWNFACRIRANCSGKRCENRKRETSKGKPEAEARVDHCPFRTLTVNFPVQANHLKNPRLDRSLTNLVAGRHIPINFLQNQEEKEAGRHAKYDGSAENCQSDQWEHRRFPASRIYQAPRYC